MSTRKLEISKWFVAAALAGNLMAANADILSGIMYGGSTQSYVVCYLYNAGTGSVSVTANSIYNEGSGLLPLLNSCIGSLASGSTCPVIANTPTSGANACRVVLAPSGADMRGEMEIRSSSSILGRIELR